MRLQKIARVLAIVTMICMLPIGALPIAATETATTPAGDAFENPKMIFEEYFDGDATGWTGADSATFEDGTIKLAKGSTLGYSSDKFGELNNKSFSFRFKTKVSGNTSDTPNKNWVRPQLAFGSNQWIATYLGYNSNSTLQQDTWYEFLYDYEPATTENASTGYQSATIYYRTSADKETWSAWETATTLTEVSAGGSTNSIKLYFGEVASNLATTVWYDDVQVYLHEEDTTPPPVDPDPDEPGGDEPDDPQVPAGDPDGVDYEPNMIFEEYFDGGASKWTGADSATFEDGAIKLGKDSAISYADDKFGNLDDKSFTFRFKTKVSGNTSETPDKNWVRPELGFGSKQWIATYLGYNSDSVLKQDIWYEFLYDYEPATTENASTGYQNATIYYRTSADKTTWSAWQTAKTVTETEAAGSTNKIKLSFSFIASNQATIVWYDDIQVYIHEPKPEEPPVDPDPDQPGTDDPVVPGEPDNETGDAEDKIYWQEDFSDGVADGFSKPSDSGVMMEVEDGALHGAVTNTVSAGAVYTSSVLGELATKDFNFRFKVKMKELEGQTQSYLDIQTSFGIDTRLRSLIGYNNIDLLSETWYEIFYAYDYNTATKALTCDIYARHQTGADTWSDWETVATDQAAGSSSYDNMLRFYLYGTNTNGCKATDIWLDDFIVYTGDIVVLDAPVIAGNEVTVGGNFCIGNPGERGTTGLTMMAVIYDTKTNATIYPATEVFELQRGSEVVKSKTFIMPELGPNQEIAVFAWDSVENGMPLSKVTGYMVPNNADELAKPEDEGNNPQPEITYQVDYNKINLSGYIGRGGVMTASLTDSEGKVCAVLQNNAKKYGMTDTDLILDGEQYSSGTYKLRVNYGGENNLEEDVVLTCKDAIANINPITSVADYKTFVESNTTVDDPDRALIATDAAVKANYEYFTILAAANDISDFNTFRECLQESLKAYTMLDTISNATLSGDWEIIEDIITDEGSAFFGTSSSTFDGVQSISGALLRLTGGYTTKTAFLNDLSSAITAQKIVETGSGNSGGAVGGGAGGGFGGGGAGGGNMAFPSGGGAAAGGGAGGGAIGGGVVPGGPDPTAWVELVDLSSVPWAEKEIRALQKLDIINGAGDGYFYPNHAITREEFLKLALMAAEISVEPKATTPFGDVDADAWYYDYVATAYQLGIVTGISETEFGIGRQITRADMAVMMDRILSYCGIAIEPTVPAYVFDDFKDIPDYAADSISNLSRIEMMNGVGRNLFMPLASATRAEAAVLVYRIYNYMNERR